MSAERLSPVDLRKAMKELNAHGLSISEEDFRRYAARLRDQRLAADAQRRQALGLPPRRTA